MAYYIKKNKSKKQSEKEQKANRTTKYLYQLFGGMLVLIVLLIWAFLH